MIQLTKSILKPSLISKQNLWGKPLSIMKRSYFNPAFYSSVRDDEFKLLTQTPKQEVYANKPSIDNFTYRYDLAKHQFFAMHQPLLGVNRDGSVQQWTNLASTNAMEADEALANWTEASTATEADIEASADALEGLIEKFATLKTEELEEYLDNVKDMDLINLTPASQANPKDHPLVSRFNGDAKLVSEQFFQNLERDLGLNQKGPQYHKSYVMSSVLRKRKVKMNKHKYSKLRKRTRALRKRLGK